MIATSHTIVKRRERIGDPAAKIMTGGRVYLFHPVLRQRRSWIPTHHCRVSA